MKNQFELIKNNKEDFEAVPDDKKEEYKEKLQEEAAELNNIKNTEGFNIVLQNEVPEAAESFLGSIKNSREKYKNYDDRWIDHREREVIKEFKNKGNWFAAKRAIENSLNINSKIARMEQLERESGTKYGDIKKGDVKENI
jgi:hypothetical protein